MPNRSTKIRAQRQPIESNIFEEEELCTLEDINRNNKENIFIQVINENITSKPTFSNGSFKPRCKPQEESLNVENLEFLKSFSLSANGQNIDLRTKYLYDNGEGISLDINDENKLLFNNLQSIVPNIEFHESIDTYNIIRVVSYQDTTDYVASNQASAESYSVTTENGCERVKNTWEGFGKIDELDFKPEPIHAGQTPQSVRILIRCSSISGKTYELFLNIELLPEIVGVCCTYFWSPGQYLIDGNGWINDTCYKVPLEVSLEQCKELCGSFRGRCACSMCINTPIGFENSNVFEDEERQGGDRPCLTEPTPVPETASTPQITPTPPTSEFTPEPTPTPIP